MSRLALPLLCLFAALGCEPSDRRGPTGVASKRAATEDETSRDKKRIEVIRDIVAKQYDLTADRVGLETPLLDFGDELNVIEVVMDIEERYNIQIPDDRIANKAAQGVGIHKDLSVVKLAEMVKEIELKRASRSKEAPKP